MSGSPANSLSAPPVLSYPDKGFTGKLIVAVHGMGDQRRNDFAQTIARLFSRYHLLRDGNKSANQVRLLPLGAWDGGRETSVDDPAVCFETVPGLEDLKQYAFAEVYWADIARSFEVDGYRLEEATHWARSVVERIAQRHGSSSGIAPERFHLASFVIEEIAATLALLQKMAMVGQLFKVTKKDIDTVLTQYLCDVEQVGDYRRQREKIRDRFFNRLEKLHEMYPHARIHLIAHSEGSAVSLFSLLTALNLAGRMEVEAMRKNPDKRDSLDLQSAVHPPVWDWVEKLESFSTLGSPIDKHLHLWPEMWRTFDAHPEWCRPVPPIRMRNYYDYADPVGYELDSLRGKLHDWSCNVFEFEERHDHGFRRYAVPGQAHLAYFTDDKLFASLIEDAVLDQKPPVAFKEWTSKGRVGLVAPMLVVALVLFVATFILDRSLFPKDGPLDYVVPLLGAWLLLTGTTVLARVQRLSQAWSMVALSIGIFLAGAAAFLMWMRPNEPSFQLGKWWLYPLEARVGLVWVALAVAFLAWVADRVSCHSRKPAVWSIRLMISVGTLAIGVAFTLPRLGEEGQTAASLFGGLAAFSTLWWLGTLLFDLAFCWQRYINVEKSWIDKVLRSPS